MIETYRPDSEECQELQMIYNRTLGLENQTCLTRSTLRARLENNLSRVNDAWLEDEDGEETFPVQESDTERNSDIQLNKIFMTNPILRKT